MNREIEGGVIFLNPLVLFWSENGEGGEMTVIHGETIGSERMGPKNQATSKSCGSH